MKRAGDRWRLLVHDVPAPGEEMYGTARHVVSHPRDREDGEWSATTVLPGTEFDELVVGKRGVHIEQMDEGVYWMNIGGVVIWLRMNRQGVAKRVDVYGPGDYDDPVPGCTYSAKWSASTTWGES